MVKVGITKNRRRSRTCGNLFGILSVFQNFLNSNCSSSKTAENLVMATCMPQCNGCIPLPHKDQSNMVLLFRKTIYLGREKEVTLHTTHVASEVLARTISEATKTL